jgi:hypothetical protein
MYRCKSLRTGICLLTRRKQAGYGIPEKPGLLVGPVSTRSLNFGDIGVQNAAEVIVEAESRFAEIFGRSYPGLVMPTFVRMPNILWSLLVLLQGFAGKLPTLWRTKGIKAGVCV